MFTGQTPLRLSRKERLFTIAVGLIVSLLLATAGYRQSWPILPINNFFFDTFLKQAASQQTSDQITIIDIDDVTLEAVGQWPWPRYRIAAVIDKLSAMSPKAIGLDIIFPEPDRTALINVQQAFKDDFDLDLSFQGVPTSLMDNDGYLASVMNKSAAIGANYFFFDHTGNSSTCPEPEFSFIDATNALNLHAAEGQLCNTDKISKRLRYRGFINCRTDQDGMLRQLPLLIEYDQKIYPNLSLAMLLKGQGENTATIKRQNLGQYISVGSRKIPVSKKGYATLNFQGPPSLYHTISAVNVLNGTVNRQDITNKYVLIGSSAVGLNDLYPTPFSPLFPGVKAHAVMLESIISNNHIYTPSWENFSLIGATLFSGLIMFLLFTASSRPLLMVSGTAGFMALQIFTCFAFFKWQGQFISPGAPLINTITLFALFSIMRYATEKRQAHLWLKRLAKAQQLTLESMAAVAETRDPETGTHIKRTQHYVKALAVYLRESNQYPEILTENYIKLLFYSAPLHDIGKVGVPDSILTKPGRLTPEEYEEIKHHTSYGEKMISNTILKIDGDNFLDLAKAIAATHHEKWDGSGYPLGLAREEIPFSGRLMAVADVYDALIHKRCYKPAFSQEKARKIMIEGKGSHFDPQILEAFLAIEPTFKEIAKTFVDENELVLGDR